MLIHALKRIGRFGFEMLSSMGRALRLLSSALIRRPDHRNIPLIIGQIYQLGVLSILIIVCSGFAIGAVLALQGYTQLVRVGSESALGLGVALVLVMEIGPVVSALLFAGRAGSAVTAEIGLMKATEQLASMEMIGVDPIARIIAPRFWGGFIVLPLLALMFSVVGIWAGSLVAVDWLGVYSGSFWSVMEQGVDFFDHVMKGIIKSIVFGFVVIWISLYQGYDSLPTSEGLSTATTNTVVFSSVWILVLDFFLTLMMFEL